MAYAALTHTSKNVANSGTTTAIDTTGADLIVIALAYRTAGTGLTLSDNQSNTWTPLTQYGASTSVRLYYCQAPTTSATHTFTVSGTLIAASIAVMGFSGSTSSPADQQNGFDDTVSTSSTNPGSITPGQANELVITAGGFGGTNGIPDSVAVTGYTIAETAANVGANGRGVSLAYVIQTTATATNPAWSWTTATNVKATTVASFKPAAAGGTVHPWWEYAGSMMGDLAGRA